MQALPSRAEYTSALTNLGTFIIPQELKPYEAVRAKTGGPKIYSGGFAITCQIEHPTSKVRMALRLFDQLPKDLEQRYEAISEFVNKHLGRNIFVRVVYMREGIVVNRNRYPICYMDWVDGVTLDAYIRKHIGTPARIQPLADAFAGMIDSLRAIGAAHGDLSGENIMVLSDGTLVLVDYDGMFVPKLRGIGPCVAGQPNFQHPQRFQPAFRAYFGEYQDNFSSVALYLTLKALALNTAFHQRYNDDGRILFRKDDYVNPDASPLLREMEAYNELAPLVERFRQICKADLTTCPSLKDFLKGSTQTHAVTMGAVPVDPSLIFTPEGNPVFSAISVDQTKLMRMQGNTGTLVGRIHKVTAQQDAIVCEFSSGAAPSSALYLIGDALEALTKKGKNSAHEAYFNQYVKATGVVQATQIDQFLVPSIEIDDLNAITTLEGGREEADAILQGKEYTKASDRPAANPTWERKPSSAPAPAPARAPQSVDDLFSGSQRPTSLPPAPPPPNPGGSTPSTKPSTGTPPPKGWGFDDE